MPVAMCVMSLFVISLSKSRRGKPDACFVMKNSFTGLIYSLRQVSACLIGCESV